MSIGGYRPGSGRAKTGYYKGIYCGSTYELVWLIYQIDHGYDYQRFPGFLEYNGKRYYPDFLQNGTIIELKGYEPQDSVDKKNEIAKQCGYDVKVLRKDDLAKEFDYVNSTYTKNHKTLYDGYKPKYEYVCNCCNINFLVDRKKTSELKYCSRRCSLLGNASANREDNKKKISETLSGKKYAPYKRKRKQMWITDGSCNRKIDIDLEIPDGFVKGKIQKK